jgi:transglutaminase-like putative cysteine protease
MRAPKRARPRPTQSWLMAAAITVALGASMVSLATMFDEANWLYKTIGVVVGVVGVIGLVRQFLPVRGLGSLAGAIALTFALTILFASNVALGGVIPTLAVFARFNDLEDAAVTGFRQSRVPIEPTEAIIFGLVAGAGILAIILDAIAVEWRKPALTGIPLVALVALPSLFGVERPLPVLACAAAYLLILYFGIGEVRTGGAVAVGASALALGLLLPLVLPAPHPDSQSLSADTGPLSINDFVDLSENLHQKKPVPVLTYVSLTEDPQYLRTGTITDFSGTTWKQSDSPAGPTSSVASIPKAPGIAAAVPTVPRETTIGVTNLQSNRLPTPYAPSSVTGLTGTWGWNASDLIISSTDATAQGQSYTVFGEVAYPTRKQRDASGSVDPAALADYLQLPGGLPDSVAELATSVTDDAQTPFDKAQALEDYFQDSGFVYSETAPVDEGYDGASGATVAAFLEKKSGYCVHFASAMAVMARTLGIPARIDIGFVGGELKVPEPPQPPYFDVSSANLHAWPELYFEGIGWLRFEPTVSRGDRPEYDDIVLPPNDTPTESPDTPLPTATPGDLTTNGPLPTSGPELPQAAPINWREVVPRVVTAVLAISAIIILLLPLWPAVYRVIRRLRRYSIVRRRGDAAVAWEELEDSALDAGLDAATTTPRELAALFEPLADVHPAVARLLAAVETDAYSRADGTATLADLRAVRARLLRELTVRERLLAAVSPASMRMRTRSKQYR